MTTRQPLTITDPVITPDPMKTLAESMIVPIRCGGLDYIDGKAYLRAGGFWYPREVFHAGRDAMKAYRDAHPVHLAQPATT